MLCISYRHSFGFFFSSMDIGLYKYIKIMYYAKPQSEWGMVIKIRWRDEVVIFISHLISKKVFYGFFIRTQLFILLRSYLWNFHKFNPYVLIWYRKPLPEWFFSLKKNAIIEQSSRHNHLYRWYHWMYFYSVKIFLIPRYIPFRKYIVLYT